MSESSDPKSPALPSRERAKELLDAMQSQSGLITQLAPEAAGLVRAVLRAYAAGELVPATTDRDVLRVRWPAGADKATTHWTSNGLRMHSTVTLRPNGSPRCICSSRSELTDGCPVHDRPAAADPPQSPPMRWGAPGRPDGGEGSNELTDGPQDDGPPTEPPPDFKADDVAEAITAALCDDQTRAILTALHVRIVALERAKE